jgi:hypothetical protein
MKTIIDNNKGLVLYCAETFDLKNGELAIDEMPTEPCLDEDKAIYWNFNENKFEIK